GIETGSVKYEIDTTDFELSLAIGESEQGLLGAMQYSTELFEQGTIRRMIRHFQTLLEAIVSDAERRIGELPLMSEAERRQLLMEWNLAAVDDERLGQCVQALIQQQAAKTPEQIAVIAEDQYLSYAELNRRANRLAHYLRGKGVGAEAIVGLCLARSPE